MIRGELDEKSADPWNHEAAVSPFERSYRGILRALYDEAIVPGQRLAAPDLMQQFEVGRGTIREVLHRLASSGVVSMVPHRGAQVRLLSRREVYDLLDIVELLLGLAARGAAQAVDHYDGAAIIQERHDSLANTAGGFSTFVNAREQYYRAIVSLSGNTELQRLFPSAQVHIMRVQLRRFQNAADSIAISDYVILTNALLSGDPVLAEQAAREHVGYTRRRVEDLPEHAFRIDRG